jgi:mono/diheme cytochrome c family protein
MRVLFTGLAFLLIITATACDQFYDQASVRPYEQPQLAPAEGAVARDDVQAVRPSDAEMAASVEPGRLAYRRYCWPCHGPNLDGKGTVGPSFPTEFLSLTDYLFVELSDEEFYDIIGQGSGQHPPLASTMTPTERWQVIAYIRAVQRGEAKSGAPEGFKSGVNDKISGK